MSYTALTDPFFRSDRFLIGIPSEGQGDRCLHCDQYGRCLDFAAAEDWEGFNCGICGYPYRGKLYDLSGFEIDDSDGTIFFPFEDQLEGLLRQQVDHEDLLIVSNIEGLFDED